MTSGLPALRALVIYGLCLPLALMVGYLLANPVDWSTIAFFGVAVLVLCAPLLMKWHYPLAIASLNMSVVAFFIPGAPPLWMALTGLSLVISILQLTLSRQSSFVSVPSITAPLLVLLGVALLTAKFTGGVGFFIFGGSSIGGKRYLYIFGALIAYYALTARRIGLPKASLYSGLFFLGGITAAIGSLAYVVPASLTFLFWLVPPEALPGGGGAESGDGMLRLGGAGVAGVAAIFFLLSQYGVRGIFFSGKLWRLGALALCLTLSFLGGFRSHLILIMLVVMFQAWLEGLFTSRLMPVLVLGGVLMAALLVPFTSKLPLTFQRSLAFLPVQVDPVAREAARASTEWRIQIWREVTPQIPQYLWLGKGYAMNVEEWSQANASSRLQNQGASIVAGDYHNGPLSLIITFGIWGVLAFVWLLWAGGRLLYCNLRFGDPALQTLNAFLLAAFLAQVVLYLFVFGSFHSDLIKFTSLFGFSVALNGGKCRRAPAPVPEPVKFKFRAPLKPAPGLSR